MKHFFLSHFYSPNHSLNNLPTFYQGDTPMSEAANHPPVYGLPCSPGAEPLTCSWLEATCSADHGSHPLAVREEQAPSLSLSKNTQGQWSQTGLHYTRREVRRLCSDQSIFLFMWQEKGRFVTYRVTRSPAFCANGRGGQHCPGCLRPPGVRGSCAGGGETRVGGRAYFYVCCSVVVRFVLTPRNIKQAHTKPFQKVDHKTFK